MNKAYGLVLIVILVASILLMVEDSKAQTQTVTTFCSITTEPQNIIQGNTFTVIIQMSPAPPAGERFNDLYVDIISIAQGVSGYGPWSADNISTDSNGIARVNFNIQNYNGYISVEVYFGGQYFSNNTIYYQAGNWQTGFTISPSITPPPETPPPPPPQNTPLGPIEIHSEGHEGTYVHIFSPQNQSAVKNPIVVLFCIRAAILAYSEFGTIGYSVDGGTVYSITEFMNQTIVRDGFTDDTTIWANVTLPSLSEGSHDVTVYWGWYFPGMNQRFEVSAYQKVVFTIGSAPSPTPTPSVPEFPISALMLVVLAAVSLSLLAGKRKHRHQGTIFGEYDSYKSRNFD